MTRYAIQPGFNVQAAQAALLHAEAGSVLSSLHLVEHGAALRGADLGGAALTGAALTGAVLRGADHARRRDKGSPARCKPGRNGAIVKTWETQPAEKPSTKHPYLTRWKTISKELAHRETMEI